MIIPFRKFHLLQILDGFKKQTAPFDLYLYQYFKKNKALGSKDRLFIADTAYGIMRWQSLLKFLEPDATAEKLVDLYLKTPIDQLRNTPHLPLHASLSTPPWLLNELLHLYGSEATEQICLENNRQASITIRVNLLKSSRDALFELLSQDHAVRKSSISETALLFDSRTSFFNMEAYKQGLFEVQDEGSQLLADLVQAVPGNHVLDFCAGSGGKSLAIAARMEGKGQIYLHDIRNNALAEAKKRCQRAGVQNVQFIPSGDKRLNSLKGKMDWVLVDAPCSGTGTLRRNPDMKWRLTKERVEELQQIQRSIFNEALPYLAPNGKIVYATCSLLKCENEDQKEYFLSHYPLETLGSDFKTLPTKGGPDGFFGVVLKRKNR